MPLLNKFISNFPFNTFRDGQEQALTKIAKTIEDGYKYIIIEAPTGWGKSPLGVAIAKSFNDSYYLTIQKFLQDQIMKDFPDHIVDLKGRNAYPCTLYEEERIKAGCDKGKCKIERKKAFDYKCLPGGMDNLAGATCPYFIQLHKAMLAQTCLMNFKSFLFQSAVVRRFGHRELMIIDEAHNTESELMNFVCLNLSDAQFKTYNITFPKYDTAEEYAVFFIENNILDIIVNQLKLAQVSNDAEAEERLGQMIIKLSIFMRSIKNGGWVSKYSEDKIVHKIELKPIFIREYARDYLFMKADIIILMSGTILSADVVRESLGIPKEESRAIRLPSKFPIKNRPLIKDYAGSMSYKNKPKTFPKLVQKVNEICEKHISQRGLIHTHNFEIADYLLEHCDKSITSRMQYQNNFIDKTAMIKKHSSIPDSIIIAPAMHEGLDLPGELCEFQIISKIPYPSFIDNPQMQARMELSPNWYGWLTALKLVQSYGRGCRSETDIAKTYIIDSDFEFFLKKNGNLLPKWFREAIF